MVPIHRLALDVLKSHSLSTMEVTREVTDAASMADVNVMLLEIDREIQNLRLVVEGGAIDTDEVERRIRDLGGTVRSVDGVVASEALVEY